MNVTCHTCPPIVSRDPVTSEVVEPPPSTTVVFEPDTKNTDSTGAENIN